MRRFLVAAGLVVFGVAGAVVTAQEPAPSRPVFQSEAVDYTEARAGDGYSKIAREMGLSCTGLRLEAFNNRASLFVGSRVDIPPDCRSASPTTTTIATTTTTIPPTTTEPAMPDLGFADDFNGATYEDFEDRWRWGVYHRDDSFSAQPEWQADHAFQGGGDCSTPDQTHTVHRANPDESLFLCSSVNGDTNKGHLMTSMGDTSPYSIVWFAPARTFTDEDTVSWDVNVTDLGTRQWWEVMLVPASGPDLACEQLFPCGLTTDHLGYPADSLVVVNNNRTLRVANDNGGWKNPSTWFALCNQGGVELDQAGCDSKTIRRSFELTDNHDGTITLTYSAGSTEMYSWTMAGSFPAAPWKVVLKDHSYTPIKDGPVAGHTWHWDNIAVR